MLKENEILKAALEVWNNFPNCNISLDYALYYRIAQKVINNECDNTFFGE